MDKNKVNGIVLKIKDDNEEMSMHLFLVDDTGSMLDMPSIPLTDEEEIYKDFKETQIGFVNVDFKPLDPNGSLELNTFEDFKKFSFAIRDLFSCTIYREGTEDEEVTALETMHEKKIFDLVKQIYRSEVLHEN